MSRIAIIPARSGSKGLRDKNIKLLRGKPLMAYTIEAAIESGVFDCVHVSTDSEKYAEIARSFGADVRFLRSEASSSDAASSWDVVREVMTRYSSIGHYFDECMLLQPTSPLRDQVDIKNALNLAIEKNAQSVVSVCEVDHPVQWCFELPSTLSMDAFNDNPYNNVRRQDLVVNYRENGAIYFFKTSKLYNSNFNFYYPSCFAYIMDKEKSIDIDVEMDFKMAEVLMEEFSNGD